MDLRARFDVTNVHLIAGVVAATVLAGCGGGTDGGKAKAPAASAAPATVTIRTATNYSVAASPDGRTLVVDILGSLWTLPGGGGPAKKITEELIEARMPTFSPDGSAIVFQGFKDNDGWDLWSIGPDGGGAKRITSGPFDDMEPQWSHDGTRVAFSSDRNRSFDVWILDVRSGDVRALTSGPGQEYMPAWSPDDKEIAFVRQPAPTPGSAAGPARQDVNIVAVNVQTGAERAFATVDGRVGPPSWTPDGRQVVYNLISGGESRLDAGGQPLVKGEDVFPARVQWTSGSDFLYTADGKIKRRRLGGGDAATVEFTLDIPVNPPKYKRKTFNFDNRSPRKAHGIVRPVISPDGTRVAFAALGDVWVMDVGAAPKRITNDAYIDTDPAWSPDGRQIVFSSDRAQMGNLDLWVTDLAGGKQRRLTTTEHADFGANWSPDGKRLAFLSMLPHQQGAAVCTVNLAGGKPVELWRSAQRIPSYPTWSADGRTVLVSAFDQYSQRYREGVWKPLLIPFAGGQPEWVDVTPHVSLVNGVDEGPVWSPDGTRLALAHEGLLKVMAVENGKPTGRFTQLTSEPVNSPSWTKDSRKILVLATDRLQLVSVDGGQPTEVPLDLTYQSRLADNRYVIHASRLWNGRDASAQTDVDIAVEGNRIKSVEPHSDRLHTGATVVDASGRTVIPGLIDMHGHTYREYGEAAGRLILSYGVTTVRDPVGMGYRCLELKEATESGARIGPRFYFSYSALDGARGAFAEMYSIYSMDRLERELQRAKRLDFDLMKMYVKLPLAMQKRVVEFAHQEMGVPVTSHFMYPESVWGMDGTEHTGGKVSALGNVYDDMLEIFMKGGVEWCPTLAVTGGYDLVAADDPTYLDDERLKKLCPEWALAPSRLRLERAVKAGLAPRAQALQRTGKALAALTRAGVPVLAGTDAPNMPSGVGLQAELELLVRAGLTPAEALKTATVNAAHSLAAGNDLGTIEPGRVADMVIVNGDPLADIKNARKVATVIKNGEVIDIATLLSGKRGPTTPSTVTTAR